MMRRWLCAMLMLSACQLSAPTGKPDGGSPLTTDAIATTTLGDAGAASAVPGAGVAPPVIKAGPTTPHPKPKPTALAATPAKPDPASVKPADVAVPDAPPPVPPSPQQVLCEKSRGEWATAGGSGLNVCVKRTRDGGKHCSQKGDCTGQCLARSQTCSPIVPMIGCNDILDSDGRMETMCLN